MEIAPFNPAPILPGQSEQNVSAVEVQQRLAQIEQLNAEEQAAVQRQQERAQAERNRPSNFVPEGITPTLAGFNSGIRDIVELNERANVIDETGTFGRTGDGEFDFAASLQQFDFVPGFEPDNELPLEQDIQLDAQEDEAVLFDTTDTLEELAVENQQLENLQVVNQNLAADNFFDNSTLGNSDPIDIQQLIAQLQSQSDTDFVQENQLLNNLQPIYEQLGFTIDQLS